MTKKVKPVRNPKQGSIEDRLAGILIDALMHKFTFNGLEANNILFLESANLISMALSAEAKYDLSVLEATTSNKPIIKDFERRAYSPIEIPKETLEMLEEGESLPHITFRIEAVRESEKSEKILEVASEVLEDFLRRDEAEMEKG